VEDVHCKAVIESLIFVSETPLSPERIKEVLGEVSKKDVQRLLSELKADYEATGKLVSQIGLRVD